MIRQKVVIRHCRTYEPEIVLRQVRAALAELGGMSSFVSAGMKVLIKPNMLSARTPEEGVTTHPAVLEAVIEEVQAAGGIVSVGDSPSGAVKGVERCWRSTGFQEVCERLSVQLVNFEAGGTEVRSIEGRKYHIARAVLAADAVINLPKMKTHGFTLYTGAVKNMFGTLPGFQKANYHKLYPHPEEFSSRLVDIYQCVKPVLTVMDGILAMEGNGPATGTVVSAGIIAAAADGIALDTVVSGLMGFKRGEIDVLRIAAERRAGATDVSDIDILSDTEGAPLQCDFKLPSNRMIRLVPASLVRLAGRLIWVRPAIDTKKCVSCGVCAESCPVQAIVMVDGIPKIDYAGCINCLCCNESCAAGAVVQQLSWLAAKIG